MRIPRYLEGAMCATVENTGENTGESIEGMCFHESCEIIYWETHYSLVTMFEGNASWERENV